MVRDGRNGTELLMVLYPRSNMGMRYEWNVLRDSDQSKRRRACRAFGSEGMQTSGARNPSSTPAAGRHRVGGLSVGGGLLSSLPSPALRPLGPRLPGHWGLSALPVMLPIGASCS